MDMTTLAIRWAAEHPWLASTGLVVLVGATWAAWRRLALSRRCASSKRVGILPPEKRRDWRSTVYNPVQFRRPKR